MKVKNPRLQFTEAEMEDCTVSGGVYLYERPFLLLHAVPGRDVQCGRFHLSQPGRGYAGRGGRLCRIRSRPSV